MNNASLVANLLGHIVAVERKYLSIAEISAF
jgi:hypothetical protein